MCTASAGAGNVLTTLTYYPALEVIVLSTDWTQALVCQPYAGASCHWALDMQLQELLGPPGGEQWLPATGCSPNERCPTYSSLCGNDLRIGWPQNWGAISAPHTYRWHYRIFSGTCATHDGTPVSDQFGTSWTI
jgi:hypothetical protein